MHPGTAARCPRRRHDSPRREDGKEWHPGPLPPGPAARLACSGPPDRRYFHAPPPACLKLAPPSGTVTVKPYSLGACVGRLAAGRGTTVPPAPRDLSRPLSGRAPAPAHPIVTCTPWRSQETRSPPQATQQSPVGQPQQWALLCSSAIADCIRITWFGHNGGDLGLYRGGMSLRDRNSSELPPFPSTFGGSPAAPPHHGSNPALWMV